MSISFAAAGTEARISASERTLQFGERFGIAGSVPVNKGTDVRIKFRADGADGWRLVRKIHTNANGIYKTRLRARVNGAFRAVPARGESSGQEPIDVVSDTAFRVAKHHVVLGNGVRLEGRSLPGGRRAVKIGVKGPDGDNTRGATNRSGKFGLRWEPNRPGVYRLRAFSAANRKARGSDSDGRNVTVYRYAAASWYGPGLYGNTMACGGTLTTSTLGVAHKYLPCGTKVKLRYGGHSVTVPVVDRGPYAAGREYDLTSATKDRLGFPDVGYVLSTK